MTKTFERPALGRAASTAQQSSGSISVEFELNRDIDQAMEDGAMVDLAPMWKRYDEARG